MKGNLAACFSTAIAGTALLATLTTATADDVQSLKQENTELRQRLDKLSSEMDQIKSLLAEKGVPTTPAKLNAKPVSAGLEVKLYGYVKLDASYDDSRVNVGDYARWVESEGVLNNDSHFNMTANQTRLGMLVDGGKTGDWKTGAQVEVDFYGGFGAGATENKPEVLVRHAFLKAEQPDWNFSLLAGQTADIISPLVAPTVNYTVAWWQGNIGYRRPQIRLTQAVKLAKDVELKLEAGATRTITDRRLGFTGALDPDSGADAACPTVQGRASLSFPSFNNKPATLGVSGHWGREEQHTFTNLVTGTTTNSALSGSTDFDNWSGNVDLRVPITDWLLFQAEGYIGANVSAYLGGIGQGFDTTRQDTIAAMGGWAAATLGPWGKWQFNLGAGIDTIDPDDVTANAKAPPRLSNLVGFGNASYSLTANLQLALELSYLRTTYKKSAAGDDWREQLAVIYKF
jgi:hypothetical protein